MNYNSIESIFSAGITNMETLRSNNKQDDNIDFVTGVDWFVFNDAEVSEIIVSGNSYFGFGEDSEHLKVNRRDTAMWSLYREEGTLYGYYKFLKIRWCGYSSWNASDFESKLEYDVILWDTGDISLHMVSIPTSNNDGWYELASSYEQYTYVVSEESTDVTFKKIQSGFEVQNSVIALPRPTERYLVRDGSSIYSVSNNVLTLLDTSELSSTLFLTYGVNYMPEWSTIKTLNNPEILYWLDFTVSADRKLAITIQPPLPQTVFYSETIPEGQNIQNFYLRATDDVLFSMSFDNGETWKYWNDVEWIIANSNSDGMSGSTLSSLNSSILEEVMTSNTYQIRCVLPSITSTIKGFCVIYV